MTTSQESSIFLLSKGISFSPEFPFDKTDSSKMMKVPLFKIGDIFSDLETRVILLEMFTLIRIKEATREQYFERNYEIFLHTYITCTFFFIFL